MKLKKWISIVLAGTASVSLLAGCGASGKQTSASSQAAAGTQAESKEETQSSSQESAEAENSSQAETSGESEQENTSDSEAKSGNGNTLVVYYSASGNTARVAKAAAEAAGADLYEIVPVEPYTNDDLNWRDNNSRVSKEHDDESLRDVELVSTKVENWDSYDTVLIGYPIWWGIAAWPTDSFVKANDFTGKTVIPFCTAASSEIGQSGKLLADLAGTGNWLSGTRFSSGVSDADVAKWIDSLGLGK